MPVDKSMLSGSTIMLILKLLEEKDMYGYEMIESLSKKSKNVFSLKAGTLYPLLHSLEEKNMVKSYEKIAHNSKLRKYYSITEKGLYFLSEKKQEWNQFSNAVNNLLKGGIYIESI